MCAQTHTRRCAGASATTRLFGVCGKIVFLKVYGLTSAVCLDETRQRVTSLELTLHTPPVPKTVQTVHGDTQNKTRTVVTVRAGAGACRGAATPGRAERRRPAVPLLGESPGPAGSRRRASSEPGGLATATATATATPHCAGESRQLVCLRS